MSSRSDSPPQVSVVMPVRNGSRHVDAAVESILAQTFGDFEFVVVDDGSVDDSVQRIERYARSDPRVKLISSGGSGLVAALMAGVGASTAGWIARMDADDVSTPTRLNEQVTFLSRHPEVALIGTSAEVIDDDGRPCSIIRYPLEDALIRLALRAGTTFAHGSVLMRKSDFERAGGYRSAAHPAEDYDLWCRMVAAGAITANLDAALYRYRLSPGGVSRVAPSEQERAAAEIAAGYGTAPPPLPSPGAALRAVRRIDSMVRQGSADARALRRVSRSLLESARGWARDRNGAAVSAAAAAGMAEALYRVRRTRA